MKRFLYTISIILTAMFYSSGQLSSQEVDRWSSLDPFLKHKLRHQGIQPEMFRSVSFPDIIDSLFNGVLDEPVYHVILYGQEAVLNQLEIHRNSITTDFSTARIDLHTLHMIAGKDGIKLIEHGAPMKIMLDESRSDISADNVQEGNGLEKSYTGNGVIVGIIDTGIDIYHPDFLSFETEHGTRIFSIWDTTLEPEDNEDHPSGFDYGVEYTKENIDAALENGNGQSMRTRDSNGHGTHVAGIAAGNGKKGSGVYTGIAPEAELVIVRVPASGISSSHVIDGMNYIFSLADELQKPAVVNLSIGGHGGAHDGTAPHEKAITKYSQESGRAVVVASGNSGNQKIHTGGIVAPSDTAVMSMVIDDYNASNSNYAINLLWYENLDEQGVGPFPNETMNLTIVSPNEYTLSVDSGDADSKSTDDGKIIIESYGKNEKDARLFYIEITDTEDDKAPAAGTWDIILEHSSGDGNVQYNMWNTTQSFGNGLALQPSSGREYTVTIPGTAEGAVTVGAYTTKNTWTDINGTVRSSSQVLDDIATFSGGGPTRDNRLKPNITAPGHMIAAAYSDDASFSSTRQVDPDGYVVLEGTSMAAPHITGTVALLFESDPGLNTEQIKQLLSSTARSDDYTGSVPNTTWGYGKVDVYDAIIESGAIVTVDKMERDVPNSYTLKQNYPNPFNPVTVIRYGLPVRTHVTLEIYNAIGQLIATPVDQEQDVGKYEVSFDASHLPSGLYFYRMDAGEFTKTRKAVFIK